MELDLKGSITFQCGKRFLRLIQNAYQSSLLVEGAYGIVCSSVYRETNEKVAIKKIHNVF